MAREIDPAGTGIVVELGGGTGSITQALLGARRRAASGSSSSSATARSPPLLRQRFPGVKVVRGDAAELGALLRPLGDHTASTPWCRACRCCRCPSALRRRIVAAELRACWASGGTFVQFTYGVASPLAAPELGLIGEIARRIWRQFPARRGVALPPPRRAGRVGRLAAYAVITSSEWPLGSRK